MERWRPVLGAEGHYEVSDLGRVRALARTLSWRDRWGAVHVVHQPPRLLTARPNPRRRYLSVGLTIDGRTRTRLIHTLVLEAFVGPRPRGLVGCHGNGINEDNRLVNLRWDTQAANIADTVRHGTNHQARKVSCPRGHPLVAPNLVRCRPGAERRTCLACDRARAIISYLRKRGRQAPSLQQLSDQKFAELVSSTGPGRRPADPQL